MTSNLLASSPEKLEELRLETQRRLDGERTASERNALGQFATPPALAMDICRYVVGIHEGEIDFLEPSCGSGAFFSALLRVTEGTRIARAVGVELDPRFASAARELWSASGLEVIEGDYLETRIPVQSSLLIANPPYVRHHHLEAGAKVDLVDRVHKELGIKVSGLAGLYVYFLLLSHRHLKPGAISAWLIPSEFLDVNYGKAVKEYLTTKVKLLRIHKFDAADTQFDDALVTSAVVVFRNEAPASGHVAELTQGGSVTDPTTTRVVPISSLTPGEKWSPRHSGSPATEVGPRFDELFKIRRGIATGNNAFFVLHRERAEELGIRAHNLQPMLPGPRYVKESVIEADEQEYPLLDRQLALINTMEPLAELENSDPALARYLHGVDDKTANAYLVRNRSPWYRQEQREAAPFVLTYMGRGKSSEDPPFRFIMNHSRAITTNMYLMLYPQGALASSLSSGDVSLADVHERMLELTGEQLRSAGRVYGGGLHKMEPKELAALNASRIAELVPGGLGSRTLF